jgi:O-antigen/teichoic acid export membrane protein
MRPPKNASLARNSILSLGTQVYGVLAAFGALPFIVRGTGTDGFGLLTLLWMVAGYFSVIDFGTGQSALRFLSVGLARKNSEEVVHAIEISLFLSLSLGVLGCISMIGLSYTSLLGILRADEALQQDVGPSLRLVAIGLPAQLLQMSLKSLPMAFNRYGLNALMQCSGATIQWVGGAIVAGLGGGILGVLIMTVVSRVLVAIGYLVCALWLVPGVLGNFTRVSWSLVKPFVTYGGWAAVPQLVSPLLALLERLIVTAVMSLTWVALFTVPSDTVSRALIFPMSFVNAVFPVFSGGWAAEEGRDRVRRVYERSMKLIIFGILPVALVLGVFAKEILTVWLGEEFGNGSAHTLMIMAAGMVFNVRAQVPVALLQAVGRPDVPAKIALVQAPLYAGGLVVCTILWGIVGTAAVWAVKVTIECLLLEWQVGHVMKPMHREKKGWLIPTIVVAVVSGSLLLWFRSAFPQPGWLLGAVSCVVLLYGVSIWRLAMDSDDRALVRNSILPAFGVRLHGT